LGIKRKETTKDDKHKKHPEIYKEYDEQVKSAEVLNGAAIRLGADSLNLEETVNVFKIK